MQLKKLRRIQTMMIWQDGISIDSIIMLNLDINNFMQIKNWIMIQYIMEQSSAIFNWYYSLFSPPISSSWSYLCIF